MYLESFPFPQRTDIKENDIFFVVNSQKTYDEQIKDYSRKIGAEASLYKHQYLSIEAELLASFQYVLPIVENKNTVSVKYASIIRESANLFEQLSRNVYSKLFKYDKRINILNFLSLDYYLNLSTEVIYSPLLENLKDINISPFEKLKDWNKNSKLDYSYIPEWWDAYNKIKHSFKAVQTFATLENALLSISAAYIIIKKTYGDGVVGGVLFKPQKQGNNKILQIQYQVEVSKLFLENTVAYEF